MGWCSRGAAALGLCVGLHCWASCTPRAAEAPLPEPRARVRQVPIGLCEDYPEESRSLDGVRSDFEALRAMGVHTLRVSLGWDELEPAPDRYEFSFWDAFVELADSYGITLLPYVAYTPRWNSSGGESDFWRTPPRDLDQFAELMGLLAARYQSHIRSWEIWNEPDNRDYWLGSAGQYAELLRRGAAAVHAVDARLAVVAGGLAGHLEFARALFDEHGAASFIDVVNLHAYYETWNPEPLEELPSYVAEAAELVRRHGGRQRIWVAEIGYGNFREGSRVSGSTAAHFGHEHTLDYQAVALVRSLALLLSSPSVSLVAWYELKDPPDSDVMIGDVNNRHLGVLFADRRPKPASAALTLMVRLFADGFRPWSEGVQVDPPRSPSSDARQIHAFLSARSLIVIGWLGASAMMPPASPAGDAVDDRRESVLLRVPHATLGPAVYLDALGRERAPGRNGVPAGATELELELRGDDVQIIELPMGPAR
jgi:hypothetical protein